MEKDPHPLKKKVFFDQFGRFFFGYMGIGEIIYGKIGGDFIWGILYGFCGEWIDIVEGIFWIRGGPEISDEKSGRKFAHAIAPRLLGTDGQV